MERILEKQREYFASGVTLPWEFRREMLKRLRQAVLQNAQQIEQALKTDLGKSPAESFLCETGMVLTELSYMLKRGRGLSRSRRVPVPLAQFPAKSYVKPVPYGNVLIMSPWNYPFLLTVGPLVDALAAGNTAVIKPSAYAPATAEAVEKLIADCFPPEYVKVIPGGREENGRLLDLKFQMIFFTGSQRVGREVLRHGAENCIPAVLELGGKSPCIVDKTANIPLAARKIVFGKFLNCGQTCVAPDYILCQTEIKDRLLQALQQEICRQYGRHPLENPQYGKIINEKHFKRLLGLLEDQSSLWGGESRQETLQLAPAVLDRADWQDRVMQEEIFGPILPVLTYEKTEELPELMAKLPEPLAFYVFTEDRRCAEYLTSRCQFGGDCINDTVIHLASPHMGFGGVGASGMGAYHGETGFRTFSHRKSIVVKKSRIDVSVRYQPYGSPWKSWLIHRFLK